jgi:hypothetical protein
MFQPELQDMQRRLRNEKRQLGQAREVGACAVRPAALHAWQFWRAAEVPWMLLRNLCKVGAG